MTSAGAVATARRAPTVCPTAGDGEPIAHPSERLAARRLRTPARCARSDPLDGDAQLLCDGARRGRREPIESGAPDQHVTLEAADGVGAGPQSLHGAAETPFAAGGGLALADRRSLLSRGARSRDFGAVPARVPAADPADLPADVCPAPGLPASARPGETSGVDPAPGAVGDGAWTRGSCTEGSLGVSGSGARTGAGGAGARGRLVFGREGSWTCGSGGSLGRLCPSTSPTSATVSAHAAASASANILPMRDGVPCNEPPARSCSYFGGRTQRLCTPFCAELTPRVGLSASRRGS